MSLNKIVFLRYGLFLMIMKGAKTSGGLSIATVIYNESMFTIITRNLIWCLCSS